MASPVVGPVVGNSDTAAGVTGTSNSDDGVVGRSNSAFGVFGASVTGVGVRAVSEADRPALEAQAKGNGRGVDVSASGGPGVVATSNTAAGVTGTSNSDDGVVGRSNSAFGVFGASVSGVGIRAVSEGGRPALEAQAKGTGRGVDALGNGGPGLVGTSNTNDGVFGISTSGVGVHGKGGKLAGLFEGDVQVTGDVRLLNADCAEDFDIADRESAAPGTVMVLGEGSELRESYQAYDKRVVGVVSGAGQYKPGIVLDTQPTSANRRPIALLGKVYCKVDAQFGAVEVGDLLTSSPTLGHAMKTSDPSMAFGAVIGKALHPLKEGQALIPILIALQ
jgi:hypothetical protein